MSERRIQVISRSGLPDVAEVFVGLADGSANRALEFVDGLDPAFPRRDKWIVNISTQYGCPVRCPFCDAGTRFMGNISAELMLEQIRRVLERHPPRLRQGCGKLKVHFARMGEPAFNSDVLKVLQALPDLCANPDLWACLPTTAPRGQENWFEGLLRVKRQLYPGRFQLQFSVNATDAAHRRWLMPHPHLSMEEIAAYGERFWQPGDRRVALNFALAQGVEFDPAAVLRLFDPLRFAVKLTPLNPTARGRETGLTSVLRATEPHVLDDTVYQLRRGGFEVIVSIGDPREDQVGSNCGQAVRHALLAQDQPARQQLRAK